ncbi:hypothetical protein SIXOD_v1c05870 [Spiroplasma ixodetis Y32]|nr:hypothetical protein SIXOD_v1c05870 [Spiroplasma ixodetis Y32]
MFDDISNILFFLNLEVFKLVQEHMIHLFFFKLAIYFKQSCSVWKALLNSFNFIVSSTSTCGERSPIINYVCIYFKLIIWLFYTFKIRI